MKGFLTEEQIGILRELHYSAQRKKSADRIKAVLFLNEGFTYEKTAELLMLDSVTVRRYEKQFKKIGIDGLLEFHYRGGLSRLTKDQERELDHHLEDTTYLTASSVIEHVKKQYNVTYSLEGITKVLYRLGFSYKKPKIVPGKADPVKQAEFLKKYQELKVKAHPEDHIYFGDGVHPTHNTHLSYGWIKRGKDKHLPANSGRTRININGALELKGKTAIILSEETINAESMIRLGKALLTKHSKGKIYLIVDNARYNHAKKFKEWRKRYRRLKVIFLSSYSPQFNVIERLWRFMYQRVLANRYFSTFDEFQSTIMEFFTNLDRYRSKLNTLLTDNFQTIPNLQLQT